MENKEPRVSQDSLSREEKIKRIYEVIMPTYNYIRNGMHYKNKCMIGDVLDYLNVVDYDLGYVRGTDKEENVVEKVLLLRRKLRQALDVQSDKCIDYIYSFIKEGH